MADWSDVARALQDLTGTSPVDLARLLQASLRALPSVLLIPAFGLAALPLLARAFFALTLAACVTPLLAAGLPAPSDSGLASALGDLAAGAAVAAGCASAIWIAAMTGNVLDAARGPSAPRSFASVGTEASPLGALLGLAGCLAFIYLGGPARLAAALASTANPTLSSLRSLVATFAHALDAAILLAAPLLILRLVAELVRGMTARVAGVASVELVLRPLEPLIHLLIVAALLERIANHLARFIDQSLPP